jgi:hypothetical protein
LTPWAREVVEQSTEIRPAAAEEHSTDWHSMAHHTKALSSIGVFEFGISARQKMEESTEVRPT